MNSRKIFVSLFFVMIMLAAAGCQAAGPSSPAATSRPTAELAAASATPGAPAGEERPSPSPTEMMTPTATPSPTNTPAPTATATPTATPTPIPTLPPEQVGGLSGVPDPHQSDPDLFDLTDPDAPIPLFLRAMNAKGLNLDPQKVSENLRFEISGDNIYMRTSNTGNEFSDGVCLIMAKPLPSGKWRWDVAEAGEYWQSFGKYVGVYMSGDDTKTTPFPTLVTNYFGQGGMLAFRGQVRPGPDIEERKPTNPGSVRTFRMAKEADMALLFHYVAEPGKYPNYVTPANVDQWLRHRLSEIAAVEKQYQSSYPILLVYNEPWELTTAHWWNHEREPLRERYGDHYLGAFVYQVLKVFIDDGFVPNKDFIIVINDDTSPLMPSKAKNIRQALLSAENYAFDQLWSDRHYREQLRSIGINSSADLHLLLGLQMNKRETSPERVMQLLDSFSDLELLLTEIELFGGDDFQKATLIRKYVELVRLRSNVKGFLFFSVFSGDEPLYPQTNFFDSQNNPNFLYYQTLR